MKKIFLSICLIIGVSAFSAGAASAMNKAELIDAIASKSGLNKRQATQAVNVMLAEIMETVARGERVMLPEFGTFSPDGTPVRAGRNPQTGKSISIPARPSPTFKPSPEFENAMKVRASVKRRSTN